MQHKFKDCGRTKGKKVKEINAMESYHAILLEANLRFFWIGAFIIIEIAMRLLRAAFKFGRRVHFALQRKMLKSPIARLPVIY